MNRVYLKIEGRVQRVGFRRWVISKICEIGGISGWIRNIEDGSVEILMTGETAKINQMIQYCYQGPLLARVDKISFITESPDTPKIKTEQFLKL